MPISLCQNDSDSIHLEKRLIHTEHPLFNEPYIQHLLATSCPHLSSIRHSIRRTHLRLTLKPPQPPARFTQSRLHPRHTKPRAPLSFSTSSAESVDHLAAAACNTLGRPLSGEVRRELYQLTPAEWLRVWRAVLRAEHAPPRAIGLRLLHDVRRYRGWPRPFLTVQGALQWTPGSNNASILRSALNELVTSARYRGQTIMVQALPTMRLAVTSTPAVTLRSLFSNAHVFYRRLGESEPWSCNCHLHPSLPRVACPDGTLHVLPRRKRGIGLTSLHLCAPCLPTPLWNLHQVVWLDHVTYC